MSIDDSNEKWIETREIENQSQQVIVIVTSLFEIRVERTTEHNYGRVTSDADPTDSFKRPEELLLKQKQLGCILHRSCRKTLTNFTRIRGYCRLSCPKTRRTVW